MKARSPRSSISSPFICNLWAEHRDITVKSFRHLAANISKQMTVVEPAIHSAPVNLSPVRYFPPISVTPWTLASPVLYLNVFAVGGIYESENRNE
jgi:hypothetical protein